MKLLDVGLAAPKCAARRRGFTLVELLIVLFIISIVTSVVLISIRHNENKQLETIAQEIGGRLQLAEEQAMLMPAVIGLLFDGRSFEFVQYDTTKKKPAWVPYDDNVLTSFTVPDGAVVSIKLKNEAEEKEEDKKTEEKEIKPIIIISTNGDITPFTISIAANGKQPKFSIDGNENGNINYQALN